MYKKYNDNGKQDEAGNEDAGGNGKGYELEPKTRVKDFYRLAVDSVKELKSISREETSELMHIMREFKERGRKKDSDWARNKIAEGHMGPVVEIAEDYSRWYNKDVADLISAGWSGLTYAIGKYDTEHPSGASLKTYAKNWIRQAISRHVILDNIIHRPISYISSYKKIRKIQRELGEPDSIELTEKIAKLMGRSLESIMETLEIHRNCKSVPLIPAYHDRSDMNDEDDTSDKTAWQEDKEKQKKILQEAMHKYLSPRERWVIEYRLGFNDGYDVLKLDELAKILRVTRQRVNQIEQKAIEKLQDPIIKEILNDWAP